MTKRVFWQASCLAIALLAGGTGGALAHALPGSLLQFQQKSGLQLTVQFPLQDLIIAAPELAALDMAKPNQPLPQDMAGLLARYLGDHLSLAQGETPLALTLTEAHLQPTDDDHLGHFILVVSQWDVANAAAKPASFTLKYDAVMHEVRNHRAIVQWLAQEGTAQFVTNFGLSRARGGISLNLPLGGQD
jgi:hypothetical protein